MPNRSISALIVLFWLGTSAAILRRDVLPRLGYGEMTYRIMLADRAVEEPVHWNILLNEQRLGVVSTDVRPESDGSFALVAKGNVLLSPSGNIEAALGRVVFRSEFRVSAVGRLQTFQVTLHVEETALRIQVLGQVHGNELEITSSGMPMIANKIRLAIDPQALVLDQLGPVDRIPGLRPGKAWTTRVINPLSAVLSPTNILGHGPSLDVVSHRVVGVDMITWNGRPRQCYLIEHRHGNQVARSWARVENGKILREEVPLAGVLVAIELDPAISKGE